ncbi:MAG: hypothetical protein JJ974_04830 [Phycisphaerales bacterium]|nr:hypothetical protein [Phycisphaerales bacterium]
MFHQFTHHHGPSSSSCHEVLVDACGHAIEAEPVSDEHEHTPSELPVEEDCDVCLVLAMGIQKLPPVAVQSLDTAEESRVYRLVSLRCALPSPYADDHPARGPPIL